MRVPGDLTSPTEEGGLDVEVGDGGVLRVDGGPLARGGDQGHD